MGAAASALSIEAANEKNRKRVCDVTKAIKKALEFSGHAVKHLKAARETQHEENAKRAEEKKAREAEEQKKDEHEDEEDEEHDSEGDADEEDEQEEEEDDDEEEEKKV